MDVQIKTSKTARKLVIKANLMEYYDLITNAPVETFHEFKNNRKLDHDTIKDLKRARKIHRNMKAAEVQRTTKVDKQKQQLTNKIEKAKLKHNEISIKENEARNELKELILQAEFAIIEVDIRGAVVVCKTCHMYCFCFC